VIFAVYMYLFPATIMEAAFYSPDCTWIHNGGWKKSSHTPWRTCNMLLVIQISGLDPRNKIERQLKRSICFCGKYGFQTTGLVPLDSSSFVCVISWYLCVRNSDMDLDRTQIDFGRPLQKKVQKVRPEFAGWLCGVSIVLFFTLLRWGFSLYLNLHVRLLGIKLIVIVVIVVCISGTYVHDKKPRLEHTGKCNEIRTLGLQYLRLVYVLEFDASWANDGHACFQPHESAQTQTQTDLHTLRCFAYWPMLNRMSFAYVMNNFVSHTNV